MTFIRVVFQFVLGVIFGGMTALAFSPLLASLPENALIASTWGVILIVLAFVTIAPTFRRALGRSILLLGTAIFVLPLSTMVLSGAALNETVSAAAEADKGFVAAGGVLAGGAATALAGFVGFVLGGVLLLLGLVLSLGGRREVVVVHSR